MTVYATPRALLLTGPQVAQVAAAAGWKGEQLVTAVAIAHAESGWDAHNVGDINLTEPGEQSTGLWQINYRPRRDASETARQPTPNFDPATNARNAYGISGGGRNFTPWSTYNNGAYKQYLDLARGAVAGVSGAPILASTTATGGTSLVAIPAPLPDAPPLPLDIHERIFGGYVDLTITKVSELSLEFIDDAFTLLSDSDIALGYSFTFEGIAWTVTATDLAPFRGDIPKLTIKASPTGVVQMRLTEPASAVNVSATDYLRQLAAAAGLGFVGQDSPVLGQVGPTQIPDMSPSAVLGAMKNETAWDIGVRLAKDLAKTTPWVMFEAAGTLFFGFPQYLASHARNLELSYDGMSRNEAGRTTIPMMTIPTCSVTRTETNRRKAAVTHSHKGHTTLGVDRDLAHINAQVDRELGRTIRPGHRASVAGIPVFDTDYMVTHVRWDVMPVPGLVTVEATDFPAVPGIGNFSTFIPAGGPQIVDPHPPASGNYFQEPRLSDNERIRLYGPAGDTARTSQYLTPWGIFVQVNNLVLAQFKAACAKAKHDSSWVPQRIDSLNKALIPGTTSWSLHAFGLAWDFFSSPPGVAPPGGVVSPQSAPDAAFAAAFKALGFYLGREFHHTGGYGTGGDWPHIEWASAPPTPNQKKIAGGS